MRFCLFKAHRDCMLLAVSVRLAFAQEVIALASKPLRPCRHPGCRTLTGSGYCEAHKPKDMRTPQRWRSWYSKPMWTEHLRPEQLLREPFCRECARRGVRTRATDVDHIIDHKGNWALFCDTGNLESLCHSCHSRKTLADMRRKKP